MAVIFDQTDIARIQQAGDIVDVIGEHVSLKKKGREMLGLCPFHEDHRPSLYVNPAKQIFKCFACGAGGDVFKFLQMREGLSFPQAVERLAERTGIQLRRREAPADRSGTQSSKIDPNRLARINEWAAKHFEQYLADAEKGKSAREYIARRQITPETAKAWRLGLAPDSGDSLLKAAATLKLPTKLLRDAGLITAAGQDKFLNRLMFTIADVTGRVIAFGARILTGEGPKYINSPTTVLFDKSNALYGLQQARHKIVETGTAVVVEGYTDCIMAHQFGCQNVVATLGTSFTTGHARIIRRYATRAVLLFDSDTAGIEAANRALEVCLSQRIDIRLAAVPQGKDPCDFLLTAGKEGFEQIIEQAVDVFQFKWDRLRAGLEATAPGGDNSLADGRRALEEYLDAIATGLWAGNVSAIDTGLLVNKLSSIIGLDKRQINAELSRRKRRIATAASRSEKQPIVSIDYGRGLFAAAQREILEVLLNEPKLFDAAGKAVSADDFDVPVLRQVAEILFPLLCTADADYKIGDVLARAESVELGSCITDLESSGAEKANFRTRLTDAMDAVRRHKAQQKKLRAKTLGDQTDFLRSVCEQSSGEDRHNIGMVH